MSTSTMSPAARDFLTRLITQIRAEDAFGAFDAVSEERLLSPFLVSGAAPGEVPLMCVTDPAAVQRLRVLYRTIAAEVERETGIATDYCLDVDAEGFGRVLVFAGRLVIAGEVFRDVNAFGFRRAEQLATYGVALVSSAVRAAGEYPEVTRVDA